MSGRYARIVARTVEGQIMSFLNDHPEVAEAWTGKLSRGKSKKMAVKDSLAKRIIGDLTCVELTLRIRAALVEADDCECGRNGGVEVPTAPPAPGVEIRTAPGVIA